MIIAILAGGKSSRFGSDKALAPFAGRTFLEHIASEATGTGMPVLVVGRHAPDFWQLSEVRFILDDKPGLGPLAGLVTAIDAVQDDVLLCGCDMPHLTTDAFRWLARQAWSRDYDGLIVTNDDRPEPLFGIYASGCQVTGRHQIESGSLSMRSFIEAGNFLLLPAPDWLRSQLININSPPVWGG